MNDYSNEAREAQRRITEKTKGLAPDLLRLRLLALANKPVGYGDGQIDPLEKSFARQALDTITARDGLERVAKAHAELEANRDPRLSKAQRLFSLDKLEQEHQLLQIKLIQAAEQDHTAAAQEARQVNAARDARSAEVVAIRAAAAAKAETLADSHPMVDVLAAAIAAKRLAI